MSENPPAFPGQPCGQDGLPSMEHYSGMSLRDYFAGQAIGSIAMLCRDDTGAHVDYPAHCAGRAYRFADAMLAARAAGCEG